MITIYKTTGNRLEILDRPAQGCWINVIDPTPAEIEVLVGYDLPQDYLTYALDLDEMARTERENGERLIVLRIPFYQGETSDIPYNTMPLGIILTSQWVVTIGKYHNDILEPFCTGKARDFSTGKMNRFVLRILLRSAERYLAYLREINKTVDRIEDRLQLSTKNKEVLELLKYQKSLTFFTTALKSNELMMERLQRSQIFLMYPEDEDLLEDVLTENLQAIEMTNIAANILSAMMDAFASIISNNLNDVMKVLTSITIVISLPTMVSSFYGMNVDLPYADQWWAWLLVLGLSLILSGVATRFLMSRDWF